MLHGFNFYFAFKILKCAKPYDFQKELCALMMLD